MPKKLDNPKIMTTNDIPVKPLIGLIGGIGSGKSLVAKLLQETGAAIINADQLNTELLQSDHIINQLVSWWGRSILLSDGKLDKHKIANIVFNSKTQLKKLEDLVHPKILEQVHELIHKYQQDTSYWGIILDAPLLLESNTFQDCTILFIDADYSNRLSRIKTRGWTEKDLINREKNQLSLPKKKAASHYIINNNGTLESLKDIIRSFIRQYR